MHHKDNVFNSPTHMDPAKLSFRQQIQYLLQHTKEGQVSQSPEQRGQELKELKEHVENERLRVLSRQTTVVPQLTRNAYREEASRLFTSIKKTNYLERKPAKLGPNEILVCDCPVPTELTEGTYEGYFTVGCGWRCLNRVISTECFAGYCPAGEHCTNKRFQLQQHAQTYPVKTKDRGWGLAAGQLIRKGTFVIQYLGEIYTVDSKVGLGRLEKYRGSLSTYLMATSHNEVIDPTRKGNFARFINHSCDPNCETQKWNVLGEICVGIFAKRDIVEDEELTFDYRFDMHKTILMKCLCGASNCRKFLGLIPSEYSAEKQGTAKCSMCKRTSGEDDEFFLVCSNCEKGSHSYCLKPALLELPQADWTCPKCERKKRPKRVRPTESLFIDEFKIPMRKTQFDVLRPYLTEIREKDVKML